MNEKLSDQWQTPNWLFQELDNEFNFVIDLCATRETSKCSCFYPDYLNNVFTNKIYDKDEYISGPPIETSFMNPPYSNPKPFIEKAWEDSKHCKIVCLVKCDPSTRWWSTFWDYEDVYKEKVCTVCKGDGVAKLSNGKKIGHCFLCNSQGRYTVLDNARGPKPGCEVRFFPKRIKFDPPDGYDTTRKYSGPAFGCALIIMDRRGLK